MKLKSSSIARILDSYRMKLKFRVVWGFIFSLLILWTLFKLSAKKTNSKTENGLFKLKSSSINLNELHFIGTCLLEEAGKKIVKIRQENGNDDAKFDLKKKKDNSVVTKADLKSHTIIVHTLSHKYPDLKINSEENSATDLDGDAFDLDYYMSVCDKYKKSETDLIANMEEINVWVDPLDATQEYSGIFRI